MDLRKHFDYCYAFTGHGIQGDTYDTSVVIFETEHLDRYVSRNWLWVAMTRAEDLDRVYWCPTPVKTELESVQIQRNIRGYIDQDVKRKRIVTVPPDYIDEEWVRETSKAQQHKCYLCHGVMSWNNKARGRNSWTADRINNDIYHSKTNFRLACLQCNTKKKDRPLSEDDVNA